MNWLERKILQYDVTVGLYMLDWRERFFINTLLVFMAWSLIVQMTGFSPSFLVTIISAFCSSALGFALSWSAPHSNINDKAALEVAGCNAGDVNVDNVVDY